MEGDKNSLVQDRARGQPDKINLICLYPSPTLTVISLYITNRMGPGSRAQILFPLALAMQPERSLGKKSPSL